MKSKIVTRAALVLAVSGVLAIATRGQGHSGKDLFQRRCGGCHALDRDKEGPHLRGVYGRAAASIASFEYSDALKNSGIRWDEKTLDQWLTDTGKLVPGNDMQFRVASAEERQAIIEYLKSEKDSK